MSNLFRRLERVPESDKRVRGTCRALMVAVVVLILGVSGTAQADEVDEAVQSANQAAKAGRWQDAIQGYERALALLPGRSALLEYNLGTAYAELGELGYATFYLRRSLQPELGTGSVVSESARRNLGIVRRRAEIQAAAAGHRTSPPEDWRDLALRALRSKLLAALLLACAWLSVGLFIARRFMHKPERKALLLYLASGLATIAGTVGFAHALAAGGDYRADEAIVLRSGLELRDGPGLHRTGGFSLQAGSQVRIVDEGAGWLRVRVRGGLDGWVQRGSVALLDAARRPRLPQAASVGAPEQKS